MAAVAQKEPAATKPAPVRPFAALLELAEEIKKTRHEDLSLSDMIGIAELLTSSLEPVLHRIDDTIQRELRGILTRIAGLRSEIAEARVSDISQNRIPQVGRELSAIVQSTEDATQTIMGAAEAVLAAAPADPKAYKHFVDNQMIAIFEACSFQDLTGQRVTRVIETIEIIEDRVNLVCRMLDPPQDAEPAPLTAKEQRRKDLLLHGPSDPGQGSNQAEIDKLF